jgi:hypothetical protein
MVPLRVLFTCVCKVRALEAWGEISVPMIALTQIPPLIAPGVFT